MPSSVDTMHTAISVFLRRFHPAEYTRVSSESDTDCAFTEKASPTEIHHKASSWPNRLLVLLLCLVTGGGGFFAGYQFRREGGSLPAWARTMPRGKDFHVFCSAPRKPTSVMLICVTAEIGLVEQTWEYDRSFGAQPPTDNSTEAQWDALIPSKLPLMHTISYIS